jgi:hypothetical protein
LSSQSINSTKDSELGHAIPAEATVPGISLLIQISAVQMNNQPIIELLQAEVDENDQSFCRVLVDGLSIKYITVEPGIYSAEDMYFDPSLVSLLPKLPTGDLNDH